MKSPPSVVRPSVRPFPLYLSNQLTFDLDLLQHCSSLSQQVIIIIIIIIIIIKLFYLYCVQWCLHGWFISVWNRLICWESMAGFDLLHSTIKGWGSLATCGTWEYLKNHTLWGMYPYTQRCQINEYIISLTVHRNEREQLPTDAAKQQALVAASTQAQRRCWRRYQHVQPMMSEQVLGGSVGWAWHRCRCNRTHHIPTSTQLLHMLSLIHIWRCRRIERCRSRWSPYH